MSLKPNSETPSTSTTTSMKDPDREAAPLLRSHHSCSVKNKSSASIHLMRVTPLLSALSARTNLFQQRHGWMTRQEIRVLLCFSTTTSRICVEREGSGSTESTTDSL